MRPFLCKIAHSGTHTHVCVYIVYHILVTFTFCSKNPQAPQTRPHTDILRKSAAKSEIKEREDGGDVQQRGKIANKLNRVNGAEHANV